MIFYHITTPEQWGKYTDTDFYEAESLFTEGFIHASYAEQVDETLKLYYQGVPLVFILKIDPSVLSSKLVLEPSRNGEIFPHIFGAINKSSIIEIEERTLKTGI
jgi:uncharacterized protein (DUF952 family)